MLQIKRLTATSKLPTCAYANDAGLDLYADEDKVLRPGELALIKTGVALAIPAGQVGLVWDKSSLANRGLHCLAGVIDSGYRGEVLINIINLSATDQAITAGQKIAQLLIQKVELPALEESEDLPEAERGERGFGSSGQN